MRKIKLLICYHHAAPLLRDEILTPVHAGSALAKKQLAGCTELSNDPELAPLGCEYIKTLSRIFLIILQLVLLILCGIPL